ncbi:MAG: hypothetical protein HC836_24695 [Richelia sp. RM2_1_2]|nr:hypothetical protein [Richelia sp. RM1_1_1]NJO61334.1 hypothetical protein [Richelia sp. RM2_1_2]
MAAIEHTNLREKLFLIEGIANNLSRKAPGEVRPQINWLLFQINSLAPSLEQEELLEALIAQVRHS